VCRWTISGTEARLATRQISAIHGNGLASAEPYGACRISRWYTRRESKMIGKRIFRLPRAVAWLTFVYRGVIQVAEREGVVARGRRSGKMRENTLRLN
jgi:hypothetical protein